MENGNDEKQSKFSETVVEQIGYRTAVDRENKDRENEVNDKYKKIVEENERESNENNKEER